MYLTQACPEDIPTHLLLGLPGCMEQCLHTTFWGAGESEIQTKDPFARSKLGLPKNWQESVRQDCCNEGLYSKLGIQGEHLNARQVFHKARGEIPKEEIPKPRPCKSQPRQKSTFTVMGA